jgi:hypothetical protein
MMGLLVRITSVAAFGAFILGGASAAGMELDAFQIAASDRADDPVPAKTPDEGDRHDGGAGTGADPAQAPDAVRAGPAGTSAKRLGAGTGGVPGSTGSNGAPTTGMGPGHGR